MLDSKLVRHVKEKVSDERFEHIMNVVEMTEKICGKYSLNMEKALIGALLHDVTKDDKIINTKENIEKITNDKFVIRNKNLWHAFTGAYYVETVLKIKDREILEAIKYHTIGKKRMSDVAKVVFIADVIEVGRINDTSIKLREKMISGEIELNELMKGAAKRKINYLEKKSISYHNNLLDIITELQ